LRPYLVGPGRQVCSIKSGCRTQHCDSLLLTSEHPYLYQNRDLMARRSPHSRSSRSPSARGLCLPESAAHLCTRGPSLHGCCQAAGQRGHGKELCHPAGPTSSQSTRGRSSTAQGWKASAFRQIGLDDKRVFERACRNLAASLFPINTLRARGAGGAGAPTYTTSCFTHRAPPGRMHWRTLHISGRRACCRQTIDCLGAVWGLGSSCFDSRDRSMQDRGTFPLQAWSTTCWCLPCRDITLC
jgi:hypothetical protein